MKTPTQLEDCTTDLRAAIVQSRKSLAGVKTQLSSAKSAATYATLPSGMREGITQLEDYSGNDANMLMLQSRAVAYKAELEVLRQYAEATESIWTASEMVDFSAGLTTEAKTQLLAIFTAALS
jgi:hypothetical protein